MLSRSAAAIALVLSTVAITAHAQPAPPSGAYAIEPRHTQVLFAISHLGFSTFYGSFSGADGSMALDRREPGRQSSGRQHPDRQPSHDQRHV